MDSAKLQIVASLNIDIMFEDTPENIESIKEQSDVICFDTEYNKFLKFNDIVRISNFNDNVINGLFNGEQ